MTKTGPRILLSGIAVAFTLCQSPLWAADDRTSAAIDAGIDFLLPATEERLKALEAELIRIIRQAVSRSDW